MKTRSFAMAILAVAVLSAPCLAQSPKGWVSVGSLELLNQAALITTPVTVFTPTATALYRVTCYIEGINTTIPVNNISLIIATLQYTNDSGEIQQAGCGEFEAVGNTETVGSGFAVAPIRMKGSIPLTLSTANEFSGAIQTTYNIYVTIEEFLR